MANPMDAIREYVDAVRARDERVDAICRENWAAARKHIEDTEGLRYGEIVSENCWADSWTIAFVYADTGERVPGGKVPEGAFTCPGLDVYGPENPEPEPERPDWMPEWLADAALDNI